jgi:hypothetical protein
VLRPSHSASFLFRCTVVSGYNGSRFILIIWRHCRGRGEIFDKNGDRGEIFDKNGGRGEIFDKNGGRGEIFGSQVSDEGKSFGVE